MAAPWTATTDGVSLCVRLTPKGGRDTIDGIEHLADGSVVLKARVRAAPTDGEANKALIRLIARAIGIPPRAVVLAAGATSRVKRLVISGDGPTLLAALEKMVRPR